MARVASGSVAVSIVDSLALLRTDGSMLRYCLGPQLPFYGHTDTVRGFAEVPGGGFVTCGFGGAAYIWHTDDPFPVGEYAGHKAPCNTAVIDKAKARLYTAGDDAFIIEWDALRQEQRRMLKGHKGGIFFLCVRKLPGAKHPVLISGSTDSTLRIWNIRGDGDDAGAMERVVDGSQFGHKGYSCVADHQPWPLYTGTGSTIIEWDMESWQPTDKTFEGHTGPVTALTFDSVRDRLYSASADTTLREWDRLTGTCLRVFEGHTKRVWSIGFVRSEGQEILFSGAVDRTLRRWDASDAAAAAAKAASAAAAAESAEITLEVEESDAKVGDGAAGAGAVAEAVVVQQCSHVDSETHGGSVRCMWADPRSKRVYTGGGDSMIHSFSLETAERVDTFSSGNGAPIESVLAAIPFIVTFWQLLSMPFVAQGKDFKPAFELKGLDGFADIVSISQLAGVFKFVDTAFVVSNAIALVFVVVLWTLLVVNLKWDFFAWFQSHTGAFWERLEKFTWTVAYLFTTTLFIPIARVLAGSWINCEDYGGCGSPAHATISAVSAVFLLAFLFVSARLTALGGDLRKAQPCNFVTRPIPESIWNWQMDAAQLVVAPFHWMSKRSISYDRGAILARVAFVLASVLAGTAPDFLAVLNEVLIVGTTLATIIVLPYHDYRANVAQISSDMTVALSNTIILIHQFAPMSENTLSLVYFAVVGGGLLLTVVVAFLVLRHVQEEEEDSPDEVRRRANTAFAPDMVGVAPDRRASVRAAELERVPEGGDGDGEANPHPAAGGRASVFQDERAAQDEMELAQRAEDGGEEVELQVSSA